MGLTGIGLSSYRHLITLAVNLITNVGSILTSSIMENIRYELKEYRKQKYIKLFILVQMLDLLITLIGILFLGFFEVNPIMSQLTLIEMSLIKFLGVMIITITLLYVKSLPLWFHKVIFWISVPPVVWNSLVIISESMLQYFQ